MQALIDFDGWRKWKDFAEANGLKDPSKPAGAPVKPAFKKPVPKKASAAEKKEVEKKEEKSKEGEEKVPDPKTLDSKGLEGVANPHEKTEEKDFAAREIAQKATGEELAKEESPDTVIHDAPPAAKASEA